MKSLLASRISSLRFLSTSAPRTLKNKVPEYQKLFQEDNGLPVHLKGGTIDAMMYRGTMILSVFAKLREQIVSFFGLRMITVSASHSLSCSKLLREEEQMRIKL